MILERSKTLTRAQLHYFHSDISDAFGQELLPVDVHTALYWRGEFHKSYSLPMMNAYGLNTTGSLVENSVKFIDGSSKKGYTPSTGMKNVSEILAEKLPGRIVFGCELKAVRNSTVRVLAKAEESVIDFTNETGDLQSIVCRNIISTIPLPFMLSACGIYTDVEFSALPISMIEMRVEDLHTGENILKNDFYQIVYLPDCPIGVARLSILGKDRIVAELVGEDSPEQEDFLKHFFCELTTLKQENLKFNFERLINPYGRFLSVDEGTRKNLVECLEQNRVFCLGRYATWSYKRSDHSVEDIKKIMKKL